MACGGVGENEESISVNRHSSLYSRYLLLTPLYSSKILTFNFQFIMLKIKNLLGIMTLGLFLASCSTKTTAISDLRSLSEDIQRNGSTYTVEEWKEVKAKYDKIDSRMGKYEYTAEEYREIGELKGKCVAYFAKGVATNVANKLGNVANQLKGVVEGVKSVVEETVGGVMKSEE